MPPGAIGSMQLQRGGPLPGLLPAGRDQGPARGLDLTGGRPASSTSSQPAPRKAGLLIGAVYRLRVTNIRLAEGLEVFPTIEVIDRLYPPPGQECRFAIPVELTEEDLKLAIDGKFVTRVIFLEDPQHALPARENPQVQNWFEAAPGQDPLAVADGLGRPVAILRLGGRLPDQGPDAQFFFGSPPWLAIPPEKPAARRKVREACRATAETCRKRRKKSCRQPCRLCFSRTPWTRTCAAAVKLKHRKPKTEDLRPAPCVNPALITPQSSLRAGSAAPAWPAAWRLILIALVRADLVLVPRPGRLFLVALWARRTRVRAKPASARPAARPCRPRRTPVGRALRCPAALACATAARRAAYGCPPCDGGCQWSPPGIRRPWPARRIPLRRRR